MKQVKSLVVIFDAQIASYEIPAFRGAVSAKAKHFLFHNHLSDEELLHRYPLIQYKRISGRPAIFCIGEGVDEIHHFFNNKSWLIHISNRDIDLKIHHLDLNRVNLQVLDQFRQYSIRQWLPLNSDNFRIFKSLTSDLEKIEMLEGILIGNIISMAKSVGWDVDKKIVARITKIVGERKARVKGISLLALDMEFQINVYLPHYIGLGKSSSLGYGVILPVRN